MLINSIKINRDKLKPNVKSLLKDLYKIDNLLLNTNVEIVINCNRQYANAIRRVITDEYPVNYLYCNNDNFDKLTTDKMCISQNMFETLSKIPLRINISDSDMKLIKLKLDITNNTIFIKKIYSGDLEFEDGNINNLMNPTYCIGYIQPNCRIVIKDIIIRKIIGRENGVCNFAKRAVAIPLDIPEYTKEEIINSLNPLDPDDPELKKIMDLSGYKIQSTESNPKKHLIKATFSATPNDKNVIINIFVETCNIIQYRLNNIKKSIKISDNIINESVQYSVLETNEFTSTIKIQNESFTIGELLKSTIFELYPKINNIYYNIDRHNGYMNFEIKSNEDMTKNIIISINKLLSDFEKIKQEFIKQLE